MNIYIYTYMCIYIYIILLYIYIYIYTRGLYETVHSTIWLRETLKRARHQPGSDDGLPTVAAVPTPSQVFRKCLAARPFGTQSQLMGSCVATHSQLILNISKCIYKYIYIYI